MLIQAFERQSVLELLAEVRYHADPPGSSFVDGLDEHIRDSFTFSPSPDSTLNHGDVIEIQGPPGSAKTAWLYFLAMTCLLPYALTVHFGGASFEVVLGGREKAVVVCDCDGRWSAKRMHHVLSAYLRARVGEKVSSQSLAHCCEDDVLRTTPTISSICERSLQLLHIFRPTSSLSFAATLLGLPFYHSETMRQQEISMLMVDGMSAFHWPDRWKAEQATHVATGNPSKPSVSPYGHSDLPSSLHASTQHVLDAIQVLRSRLGVITVLTNWALFPNPNVNVSRMPHVNSALRPPPLRPCFKQHLLPPYPAFFPPIASPFGVGAIKSMSPFTITHHITLIPTLLSSTNNIGPTHDPDLSHIVACIRTPIPNFRTAINTTPVFQSLAFLREHMRRYATEQNKQLSFVEGEMKFDIGLGGIAWL